MKLEIFRSAVEDAFDVPRQGVDNMNSVLIGLERYGVQAKLDRPQRLAHYMATVAVETMRFIYDREIWGPTATQKRYEGRVDLGNVLPGDGYRFRGRTGFQLTGRYNYEKFTKWAKENFSDAPDFTEMPDLLNTEPWEGTVPIWFWDKGNSTGTSLNRYADINNALQIRKIINGVNKNGMPNGYPEYLRYYWKIGLALLGFDPDEISEIKSFQKRAGITEDGDPGPDTRFAIHNALLRMPSVQFVPQGETPNDPSSPPVIETPPAIPAPPTGGETPAQPTADHDREALIAVRNFINEYLGET